MSFFEDFLVGEAEQSDDFSSSAVRPRSRSPSPAQPQSPDHSPPHSRSPSISPRSRAASSAAVDADDFLGDFDLDRLIEEQELERQNKNNRENEESPIEPYDTPFDADTLAAIGRELAAYKEMKHAEDLERRASNSMRIQSNLAKRNEMLNQRNQQNQSGSLESRSKALAAGSLNPLEATANLWRPEHDRTGNPANANDPSAAAGAASDAPNKEIRECQECSRSAYHLGFFHAFKQIVCSSCLFTPSKPHLKVKYALVTKTEAKEKYGCNENDLYYLPFLIKQSKGRGKPGAAGAGTGTGSTTGNGTGTGTSNSGRAGFSGSGRGGSKSGAGGFNRECKLYLWKHVKYIAEQKYGSVAGVEKEKQRRIEERAERFERKAEGIGKEKKEKRKSTSTRQDEIVIEDSDEVKQEIEIVESELEDEEEVNQRATKKAKKNVKSEGKQKKQTVPKAKKSAAAKSTATFKPIHIHSYVDVRPGVQRCECGFTLEYEEL